MPRITFPLVMKEGAHSVRIYKNTNGGGYVRYELRYKMAGKTKKERRSDLTVARARAKEVLQDMKEMKVARSEMTDEQIHHYQHCTDLLGSVPLIDAVQFYLRHHGNSPSISITVAEAVKEFLDSKSGRSPRYYETLQWALIPFGESCQLPLRDVGPSHVEAYLEQFDAGRTKFNVQNYLTTLMNWAIRKGYLPRNEPHAVERADDVIFKPTDPDIWEPDSLDLFLRTAEEHAPDFLPWIALGAFGGLRAAERERLRWEHINWEEDAVPLSSAITKNSRRRVVPLSPVLSAWLLPHAKPSGLVCPYRCPSTVVARLKKLANMSMPHNALRHSFVSYSMARGDKAHHVAETTGHSVGILQSRYKAITYKRAAERWFSLYPTKKDAQEENAA